MVCRTAIRIAAACLVAGSATGCGDAAGAGGPTTRQTAADRALADPWGYGPKAAPPDKGAKPNDNALDRNGLKRDLGNVFNP